MPEDLKTRLDAVLRFRDAERSGSLRFGSLEVSGGDPVVLGTSSRTADAAALLTVIYDHGWCVPFDWAAWDGAHRYSDPARIAEADIATIEKLWTMHVRLDRFCDGHLENVRSSGHIRALFDRMAAIRRSLAIDLQSRSRGALLGLAAGDALGTTVEFCDPGTFTPLTDIVGGGPFHLEPGQWTDDTSMALCLAESLLECDGFDASDQLRRYLRWWREGRHSSTGSCFDIGITVREALSAFDEHGDAERSGATHERSAGNGSLMRLAPVPLFYAGSPREAIAMSAASSRTTHAHPEAVDACRYFAALILGALQGRPKEELLGPSFSPVAGLWDASHLLLQSAKSRRAVSFSASRRTSRGPATSRAPSRRPFGLSHARAPLKRARCWRSISETTRIRPARSTGNWRAHSTVRTRSPSAGVRSWPNASCSKTSPIG